MKTIEYRTHDKSTWGPGPWQDEPDKKQWQDAATGFPCLIVRNHGGALCGYVGVPKSHPLFGKEYDAARGVDGDYISVHGGLTFSNRCATLSRERWEKWREQCLGRRDEARQYPNGDAARTLRERAKELESYEAFIEYGRAAYICHLPEPGEDDGVWWFGFDCAHAGDISPAFDFHRRMRFTPEDTYKALGYVESQVALLAQQLAEIA